jgi:bacterioferritin
LGHEQETVVLYQSLLETVDGSSVFLEEFARTMIAAEEQHQLELRKMLRDYANEK